MPRAIVAMAPRNDRVNPGRREPARTAAGPARGSVGPAEVEDDDARDDQGDAEDLGRGDGLVEEEGADDDDEGGAEAGPEGVADADLHAAVDGAGEEDEGHAPGGEAREGWPDVGEAFRALQAAGADHFDKDRQDEKHVGHGPSSSCW